MARAAVRSGSRRAQRYVRREIAKNEVVKSCRRLRERFSAPVKSCRRLRERLSAPVKSCRRLRERLSALVKGHCRSLRCSTAVVKARRRSRQRSTALTVRAYEADWEDLSREPKKRSIDSSLGKRMSRASGRAFAFRSARFFPS